MLVVAAAAIWFVVKKQQETAEETAAMVTPQTDPAPREKVPEVPVAPAPTPTIEASALATASAAPAAEASAAASIAPSASAPPAASAAPAEPATTGNAASDAPAPTAEGTRVVTVTMMPPDARLFWKGKSLGKSPVRIELPPGEKRRFEVGRPGYVTRRLVVDGSQSEVSIGLRPDPSAPAPSQ
jgi:hypothetical protein